jgi:hypothetical protein
LKPKVKREKSTSTKGHYVRNADLLPAVIEAKELGKITNKLILMIQKIAERYSRKSNFIGYSFREDMVSAAVENLCKNALKFDHVKYNNPFAFYTTAIHNSFLQYMADEKKHRNIRDALLVEAGANPSFNFGEDEKDELHFEIKESDDHYVPEQEAVEEEPAIVLKNDGTDIVPTEQKIRYASQAPGVVRKYGPGDFDVDPVTGAITIKPEALARYEAPPPAPVKEKSARKRAVTKKPVTVKKSPITKKTVKEKPKAEKKVTPAKKTLKSKSAATPSITAVQRAAKTRKKAEESTKVKKPAAKKTVVKKPAAKKTAIKKPTTKK